MDEVKKELLEKYQDWETADLQELLREHAHCMGEPAISLDEVFAICQILSERHPPLRSNEEAFAEFLEYYAPKDFRDHYRKQQ